MLKCTSIKHKFGRVFFIDFSCCVKRAHLVLLYEMDGSIICIEPVVTHVGGRFLFLLFGFLGFRRDFNAVGGPTHLNRVANG